MFAERELEESRISDLANELVAHVSTGEYTATEAGYALFQAVLLIAKTQGVHEPIYHQFAEEAWYELNAIGIFDPASGTRLA